MSKLQDSIESKSQSRDSNSDLNSVCQILKLFSSPPHPPKKVISQHIWFHSEVISGHFFMLVSFLPLDCEEEEEK